MHVNSKVRLTAKIDPLLEQVLEFLGFEENRGVYTINRWVDADHLESLLNDSPNLNYSFSVRVLQQKNVRLKLIEAEDAKLEIVLNSLGSTDTTIVYTCLFSSAWDDVDFNYGFASLKILDSKVFS